MIPRGDHLINEKQRKQGIARLEYRGDYHDQERIESQAKLIK